MRKICIYLVALATCLSWQVFAQEPDSDVADTNVSADYKSDVENDVDDDAIDEITVMGARSLLSLRHELTLAEDNFFDKYNMLNEDDRYDIICKDEVHVGSRIPVRECISRVIRESRIEATQNSISLGSGPVGGTPWGREEAKHSRALQENLRTLAMQDKGLQDALMEYDALRRKYEEEHAEKFD
jgi:hypothetical protein